VRWEVRSGGGSEEGAHEASWVVVAGEVGARKGGQIRVEKSAG